MPLKIALCVLGIPAEVSCFLDQEWTRSHCKEKETGQINQ